MIEIMRMNWPKLTTGSSNMQTVSPPKWSKHYALLPKRVHSGRWIWLRHYYLETQKVTTPIKDLNRNVCRRYTVNEAMLLMLSAPSPKQKPANWGQMQRFLQKCRKKIKQ